MEPISLLKNEVIVKEYEYAHSHNASACLTVTNKRIINRAHKKSDILCQEMPLQNAEYLDCTFQDLRKNVYLVLALIFFSFSLVFITFLNNPILKQNMPIILGVCGFFFVWFMYLYFRSMSCGVSICISGSDRKTNMLSFDTSSAYKSNKISSFLFPISILIRKSNKKASLLFPVNSIDKAVAADMINNLNRVILTAQDQGK